MFVVFRADHEKTVFRIAILIIQPKSKAVLLLSDAHHCGPRWSKILLVKEDLLKAAYFNMSNVKVHYAFAFYRVEFNSLGF